MTHARISQKVSTSFLRHTCNKAIMMMLIQLTILPHISIPVDLVRSFYKAKAYKEIDNAKTHYKQIRNMQNTLSLLKSLYCRRLIICSVKPIQKRIEDSSKPGALWGLYRRFMLNRHTRSIIFVWALKIAY